MARYWVSCLAPLSRGAIAQLRDAGIYRSSAPVDPEARPGGTVRHYLSVEARNPDDALLIAGGSLAVAGAIADDLRVSGPPPSLAPSPR